jgi:hypothetical protein
MKRLLLIGVVLAVLAPSTANAAVPCRNKIYNDWYGDGKIASTYPIACYRDALKHVQPDAQVYSSLVDDIKSAMRGAIEREHGEKNVPVQIGRGLSSGVKGKTITLSKGKQTARNTSNTTTIDPVDRSSTVAVGKTSGGSGIPTPIIILGALAILLAAIGAAGSGVRYFKRRG